MKECKDGKTMRLKLKDLNCKANKKKKKIIKEFQRMNEKFKKIKRRFFNIFRQRKTFYMMKNEVIKQSEIFFE